MRPNSKFRGNVFVANLPHGYTDEELAQAFDEYGLVLGAHLARDPITGSTKGYGLVNLAPDRAAAAAAAALNGTEIGGRRIEARLADPDMAINLPRPPRAEPVFEAPTRPHFPASAAPARRPVVVEYRTRRFS